MTPQGYIKLLEQEGEVLHAYPDSEGFLTIGIGHLIDARLGGAISQRISRELYDDDIAVATARCRVHLDFFDALDPVRQDVFINLMFNMGPERLKTFKLMLSAAKDHQWAEAAFQLANSLWGRQVSAERKRELCDALEHGRW